MDRVSNHLPAEPLTADRCLIKAAEYTVGACVMRTGSILIQQQSIKMMPTNPAVGTALLLTSQALTVGAIVSGAVAGNFAVRRAIMKATKQ